jgi:hypothetical protein
VVWRSLLQSPALPGGAGLTPTEFAARLQEEQTGTDSRYEREGAPLSKT